MCRDVQMSDEDSDSEIHSPEQGDFGHEQAGGGKEGAKEGVVAARSSPDSEYDAGGEKRSIAYSIFQACTDYRQNIVNQADAYSFQATLLAVGGTICCLLLSVAIVFAIISSMRDGSKSNSDGARSHPVPLTLRTWQPFHDTRNLLSKAWLQLQLIYNL
ncbi:uncharacterized protein LOC125944683 [Dermacentor silvarum]|uniref:uncharacterized protein LOC125944683 n=1 Tax=Dermacentor silvarum TaxID=543639 RepID=UPI002101A22A|nr:uncharacterized protein LOC125944683 [Dermacentor silvarum]